MKKVLILAALILSIAACKEEQKEVTNAALFAKIDAEIKANAEAYSNLKESSETIGHRLTGSENGAKAETYVYNKLKSYGFEDVEYQSFEVEAWSRGQVALFIDGNETKVVTLGHSPVEAEVTANIVDFGNGLEVDYLANPEGAKGNTVLVYIGILEGSEEGLSNLHRSEKTALALKYGAIGIIIINQVPNGVLLTGTASVTGELLSIPAVCIGKEDGMA
jgi:hypothetical protein